MGHLSTLRAIGGRTPPDPGVQSSVIERSVEICRAQFNKFRHRLVYGIQTDTSVRKPLRSMTDAFKKQVREQDPK